MSRPDWDPEQLLAAGDLARLTDWYQKVADDPLEAISVIREEWVAAAKPGSSGYVATLIEPALYSGGSLLEMPWEVRHRQEALS